MDEWRFVLLQLCDSGFPSGAFSHSFGFETYVQEGRITDSRTFRGWLEAYLRKQWIYNEGLALRLVYEALDGGEAAPAAKEPGPRPYAACDPQASRAPAFRASVASGKPARQPSEAAGEPARQAPEASRLPARPPAAAANRRAFDSLWALDRRMTAQTIPFEARSGAVRMGRRMLELVRRLWPDIPALAEYAERIADARCQGHVAIVFAAVCHGCGVPQREALLHFAYASSVPLVQNAVRAIPLGQSDGQTLLARLPVVWEAAADAVAVLDPGDFGISPPGLELAAIRHERLDGRMFMS